MQPSNTDTFSFSHSLSVDRLPFPTKICLQFTALLDVPSDAERCLTLGCSPPERIEKFSGRLKSLCRRNAVHFNVLQFDHHASCVLVYNSALQTRFSTSYLHFQLCGLNQDVVMECSQSKGKCSSFVGYQ
jgi:hypothetical protein